MTGPLDAAGTAAMLQAVADHVIANTERLSRADQAVGDGDHGIGMARGFAAAKAKLQADGAQTVKGAVRAVGMAITTRSTLAGAMFM